MATAPVTIDTEQIHVLLSISCPSATQCTSISQNDRALTFNPQTGAVSVAATIDGQSGVDYAVCPTTSQCVAVDGVGRTLTFAPLSPGNPAAHRVDVGVALGAVACESATQCTATDRNHEVTFNPVARTRGPLRPVFRTGVGIDNELDAVACKGTRLCVAVDTLGNAVRFDPRGHGPGSLKAIDKGRSLSSVACPSTTECLSTDSAGRVVVGNPHTNQWTVEWPRR
jgi:hypothetical protein